MRLAPEGWPFVLPGLALTAGFFLAAILIPGPGTLLHQSFWVLGAVLGSLTAFVAFFFRDPVRRRRDGGGLVLAPADGRIIQVTPVEESSFLEGSATRISIFLSIFNVHIQRAPITGRIGLRSYKQGRFAAAWNHKASDDNEQCTLGITAGPHRILVRQIAGLVARRIVTYPKTGDFLPQGTRIGIIRFGSRVDLFLPREWELTCKVGDRAKAGLTVLARFPQAEEGEAA
jgi:phosphatidylserine decarboxylase